MRAENSSELPTGTKENSNNAARAYFTLGLLRRGWIFNKSQFHIIAGNLLQYSGVAAFSLRSLERTRSGWKYSEREKHGASGVCSCATSAKNRQYSKGVCAWNPANNKPQKSRTRFWGNWFFARHTRHAAAVPFNRATVACFSLSSLCAAQTLAPQLF
jgi:hypothetical protein